LLELNLLKNIDEDDIAEIKSIKEEAEAHQKEIKDDLVERFNTRLNTIFSKYI
jgi:hypothetical protein